MVKNKNKWSDLSMSERADLIKLYVNNGITSLNDIKKDYNSFGDGGDKSNIVTTETDRKILEKEGWNDRIVATMPLNGFSRKEIKNAAKGVARNEELSNEYLDNLIEVGSTKKQKRIFNRAFNKELKRVNIEKELAKETPMPYFEKRGFGNDIYGYKNSPVYDDLDDVVAKSIAIPAATANPLTAMVMENAIIPATGHVLKVTMDPTKAKTGIGTLLATASDATGITFGLHEASKKIDKWLSGDFDHQDIPEFLLDISGAMPFANVAAKTLDNALDASKAMYKTQRAVNTTKPITYKDPGLSQDYINAPGNAEGIQTNPRAATVYNKQITGQLSSKNPSKLSDAERMGIPKGERNNVDNIEEFKSRFDTEPRVAPTGSRQEYAEDFIKAINEGKLYHNYNLTPEEALDEQWDYFMRNRYNELRPKNQPFLGDAGNIHSYAKTLPDVPTEERIPAMWRSETGVSPLVQLYRGYLRRLGYSTYFMTDDDLSKILHYYYKDLTSKMSGVSKNQIFYHGKPNLDPTSKRLYNSLHVSHATYGPPLETYDIFKMGTYTGNTGRSGPGMYFSTVPSYSHRKDGYNIQPYVINNIDELALSNKLGYSGDEGYKHIKDYHTDINRRINISPREFVYRLNKSLPDESNKLVVEVNEAAIPYIPGYKNPSVDVRYRGPNQNIKSLFPHPDRFVLQPDGTVTFTPTDWNDPRFNFKNGGKLLTKRN